MSGRHLSRRRTLEPLTNARRVKKTTTTRPLSHSLSLSLSLRSLDEALREVWRSLAPGGRFFATTFLYSDLLPPGATRASRSGNGFRVFELDELRELMLAAGFEADAIDVRKEGRGCAIIRCTKAAAVAVAAAEDEAESESEPAAAPAEEEEKKLPLEERAADVARWKAAPDDEE